MRKTVSFLTTALIWMTAAVAGAEDSATDKSWRALPLIQDGKIAPEWVHMGWGRFVVEQGALKTECDEKGMGMLLYRAEPFGNCQIKVVFRSEKPKSNAGVFVRIDPNVLKRLSDRTTPVRRNKDGTVTEESIKDLIKMSEAELGEWYPVHHGYEVQICEDADPAHRTGAIYSLAKDDGWRSMVITLQDERILVDVDGKRVTEFDSNSSGSPERKWHEPKREPKRPTVGYIGLQNHDPGDVVYFKEVSVRKP